MTVPATLDTVAVVGNGLVGHGMAQIFAAAGRRVVMIGRREESLGAAMERIAKSLAAFEAHGLVTSAEASAALGRIRTSTELEDAAEAQLVLEAVPAERAVRGVARRDLRAARRLRLRERATRERRHAPRRRRSSFRSSNETAICAPPAVFASGSGQPASELVSNVTHRGRVVAAHFWYPPQLIPLVEVCAGPETDPDVAPWLCDVLRAAGKEPVVVDKEVPGFIGNRLQYAILREAWALWAEGAASAEAIDTVVKASIGRRLAITGPIESADVGGLDTLHAFGAYLIPHLTTGSRPRTGWVDRFGCWCWACGEVVRRGAAVHLSTGPWPVASKRLTRPAGLRVDGLAAGLVARGIGVRGRRRGIAACPRAGGCMTGAGATARRCSSKRLARVGAIPSPRPGQGRALRLEPTWPQGDRLTLGRVGL